METTNYSCKYIIFHSGVHKKKKSCNINSEVQGAEGFIRTNTHWFYPSSLSSVTIQQKLMKLPEPNGGWGDHRDHQLCHAIAEKPW